MEKDKTKLNSKSCFNEEEILKEEEAFIKAYNTKKTGAFKMLGKLYKPYCFKILL